MAALRELQAMEMLDGITDEVALNEDTPNESGSYTDDDFVEEFSDTCKDYPRDGIDQFTDAELMEKIQELSKSSVPSGSYRQRRFQYVWGSRFDAFRENVLKEDSTIPFEDNQIHAFLLYYFALYQPRPSCVGSESEEEQEDEQQGDSVESVSHDPQARVMWSYDTLKKAVSAIKGRSIFRWNRFELSEHQQRRADSAIETLLRDDYATNQESISSNQALGVYFVRRMSRGILQHALNGEKFSWDSAILFTLAIVLQAALNCRLGDILASPITEEWPQDQEPSLTYRDVILVLDGGDTIEDVKGEWTIRNAEDDDGEPVKAYRFDRHALIGKNDNSLCPVRLILINAIRHRNVKGGNTIEAILAQAATHPLKRVEWINPHLPVLSHVTAVHTVSRSTPMKTNNMVMAFKLIQEIVDANITIRSRDLQYGAAEDLLHVVRGPEMTIEDIAQELNYSANSADWRATRRYTRKCSIQDTWQARVHLPDKRPLFSTVIFDSDPTNHPRPGEKRKFCDMEDVLSGSDFINYLAQVADLGPPIVLPQ